MEKDFIFDKIADGIIPFDEVKWRIVAGGPSSVFPIARIDSASTTVPGIVSTRRSSRSAKNRFKPSGRCEINRELMKHFSLKKIAVG